MKSICLFALLLATLPVACANPRYADEAEATRQPARQGGCDARFRTGGQCVAIEWEKIPTDEEAGSFLFRLSRDLPDGGREPVDLAPLKVVLWMPSMGHGSSPTTVQRLGPGSYRASSVFFSMPGEWEIRFQLREGQNVVDQAIVPYSL